MASFLSAITLLGVTRENYSFGTQQMAINLAYGLGTVFAAHFTLPVFYRLKEKSIYAYLERRFGRQARFAIISTLYLSRTPRTMFQAAGVAVILAPDGAVHGHSAARARVGSVGRHRALLPGSHHHRRRRLLILLRPRRDQGCTRRRCFPGKTRLDIAIPLW